MDPSCVPTVRRDTVSDKRLMVVSDVIAQIASYLPYFVVRRSLVSASIIGDNAMYALPIKGCTHWFDATDGSVTADGTDVVRWKSRVGPDMVPDRATTCHHCPSAGQRALDLVDGRAHWGP
jgi:hypothetical protein